MDIKKIHTYWAVILLVVVLGMFFYYSNLIKKQEARHIEENNGAAIVAEVANGLENQSFDGRDVNGFKDSDKVWELVDDNEFLLGNLSYSFDNKTLSLSSGKIWKDVTTGVVWGGASDFPISNQFTVRQNGSVSGTGAFGFCEMLNRQSYGDISNWKLPTQKQLMQAYVNGAGNVLIDRTNYFWSATEFFGDSERAWRVNLMSGDVTSSKKLDSVNNYVICVSK